VTSVFLSYERTDRAVANAVVSALSTVGVQIATPESAIAGADCVIVLWSIARARSNSAEQAVKLAIKAWADDRLVLARVDEAELPLGLRDIPAIDLASDRQGGINEIVLRVHGALGTRRSLPPREMQPPRGLPRSSPTRVLISYSHDNPAHCDRVLALADRLRADGIDAVVDQYIHAPPEGWPAWCVAQIDTADFVL
jgi:hypothetical protein